MKIEPFITADRECGGEAYNVARNPLRIRKMNPVGIHAGYDGIHAQRIALILKESPLQDPGVSAGEREADNV